MNTHAQPIPTATFIGHLSIGERERLAFTNGDRCTAEMLAALDDLSLGDETPDDDKRARAVLQSVVLALSCALREPGKVGKRSLLQLADFLDKFGVDECPEELTPESARDAVYAAFGGFCPTNNDVNTDAEGVPA